MLVQTRRLTKSYFLHDKEIPVLRGLDLTIRSGEFVSLTGPSGVGKSTLLHLIGTLDTPSAGSVLLDGIDIFSQPPGAIAAFRNNNIGFVFQFHHLLPEFTALENTMMAARIGRVSVAVAAKKARELLDEVGLSHRFDHRAGELSGGEQQRVALCRALINQPRLLLADEPTGNLDEETGGEIFDVMTKLNEERGITVLLVTHSRRLAAQCPRQVGLTNTGAEEIAGPATSASAGAILP